jgi:hypothetical protein
VYPFCIIGLDSRLGVRYGVRMMRPLQVFNLVFWIVVLLGTPWILRAPRR